ncbi:MAG: site-specific integrase [Asticcacaulis sp.]
MTKCNAKNERIKRRYFMFLEEAKRMKPSSVDQVAASLSQFETMTKRKDFAQFHIEDARRFKRSLAQAVNPETGKPLAKSTIYSRLMALKTFFEWLAGQSGYRRINYSDAAYFNPSNEDTEIAKAKREKRVASFDEIRKALFAMPDTTDIEKRNRAVVAFVAMTGARDGAVVSFKVQDVDMGRRRVYQDARHVQTKFSKSFHTDFCPVGDDIEGIFSDYYTHLTDALGYGPQAPLFPATKTGLGASGHLEVMGLSDRGWQTAQPVRNIFKEAFTAVGLPYFNPHSFRDSLMQLAYELNLTHEEMKAWSQNLGHENVMTSLRSYGAVTTVRQSELMAGLRVKGSGENDDIEAEARKLVSMIRRQG